MDSGSGSDSGCDAGEGVFCLAGGLDGPARGLDFSGTEGRALDPDEAASMADISTMSESSSDAITCFLPLRADRFLDFSDGTAVLDGSNLGGTEDLADLRVGAGTSSTSSPSSLTATEDLALLALVEALELAVVRPFRGGSSCCVVPSLTAIEPSLVAPRLRLTGGGGSSTGCPSSSVSRTSLRADFDRAETRVREVVDGGFFAREGCFSTISSVSSPSTSDRPRFLRDVEGFSSGGREADADRVARRGGIGKSEGQ